MNQLGYIFIIYIFNNHLFSDYFNKNLCIKSDLDDSHEDILDILVKSASPLKQQQYDDNNNNNNNKMFQSTDSSKAEKWYTNNSIDIDEKGDNNIKNKITWSDEVLKKQKGNVLTNTSSNNEINSKNKNNQISLSLKDENGK